MFKTKSMNKKYKRMIRLHNLRSKYWSDPNENFYWAVNGLLQIAKGKL